MAEPISVYDASTASGHGVPPVAKYSYKLDAPLAGYTYELRENILTQRVAEAEAVRDQTQTAVDELTSAYRLIAG